MDWGREHAAADRPGADRLGSASPQVRARAERLVEITVDAVYEHERALPARWRLIEPYRRNPPVTPKENSMGLAWQQGPFGKNPSGQNTIELTAGRAR